jgi:hypothetical protein
MCVYVAVFVVHLSNFELFGQFYESKYEGHVMSS